MLPKTWAVKNNKGTGVSTDKNEQLSVALTENEEALIPKELRD